MTTKQRLRRYTMHQYAELFIDRLFIQNHLAWVMGFDSEVESIKHARHRKLYRIRFCDGSETVADHTAIVYVAVLPGIIKTEGDITL